jgi:hypothetical protein
MAVKLKKDTDVKEQALNILLNNVFIENSKTRRWGICSSIYVYIKTF